MRSANWRAISVSPDGRTLAFRQNYEVFAMPLLPGGQAVEVAEKASSLPVTQASKGGASYIGWADNGRTLTWSMGPTLYRADVATLFANAPLAEARRASRRRRPASRWRGPSPPTGPRARRADRRAHPDDGGQRRRRDRERHHRHHAATGSSRSAPRGSVSVPGGRARSIDMAGKTIMPGLVDAHAHGGQGQGDLVPQQNWS